MLRWKGMTQSRGRDGTIHQKVLWESRWSLGLVFLPLTRASVADPICLFFTTSSLKEWLCACVSQSK